MLWCWKCLEEAQWCIFTEPVDEYIYPLDLLTVCRNCYYPMMEALKEEEYRPYAIRSDCWLEKWPIRFEDEDPEAARILAEVVCPRLRKWRGLMWWHIDSTGTIRVKFKQGYYPQRNKPCLCGSGKLLRFCCEFLINV